jgi:hypothetical protein
MTSASAPLVRHDCLATPRKSFLVFIYMAAWATQHWTSALEAATICLRNHEDSEEPIAMRERLRLISLRLPTGLDATQAGRRCWVLP